MGDREIARLPRSGVTLEWIDTSMEWRILGYAGQESWRSWQPAHGMIVIPPGKKPQNASTNWWVIAGTTPDPREPVSVTVDGTTADTIIYRAGRTWAFEGIAIAVIEIRSGVWHSRVNMRRRRALN